jgi:hypothetical protein
VSANDVSVVIRTASQVVVVGVELKNRLEHVARHEGRDATNLAQHVLADYCSEKELEHGTRRTQ